AKYFRNWFFMIAQTPLKSKAARPLFPGVAEAIARPQPSARAALIRKNTKTRAPGFIDLLHERLLFREDGWFRRGRWAALVRRALRNGSPRGTRLPEAAGASSRPAKQS